MIHAAVGDHNGACSAAHLPQNLKCGVFSALFCGNLRFRDGSHPFMCRESPPHIIICDMWTQVLTQKSKVAFSSESLRLQNEVNLTSFFAVLLAPFLNVLLFLFPMSLLLQILTFLAFFSEVFCGGNNVEWGYSEKDGPDSWKGKCQEAYGRQSPIDIRATDVDYTPLHRLHFIHYDHPGPVDIFNSGTSVVVSGFGDWGSKQPIVQGGGLKHRYKLAQFHLHWGHHDAVGSEHTLGSLHYPAELHLVHVREGLTLAEAQARPDGLAVVGVFLARTNDPIANRFSALSDHLGNIEYDGNHTKPDGFRVKHMLPYDTEAFYRYEGSLTTPTCDESVIWTLLAEPIAVSKFQLQALRNLKGKQHDARKNFRPTQPLNGRRIQYRPSKLDRALICSSAFTPISGLLFLAVFYFLF
ncbi:unnamed protein product [Caenorhabditis auriculariae]|uniref:Carbonic anhydrase n=1 Tax=Caenorhabditis auriculariae TaxID=2777116 RepID=A0A8S1H0P0_9PELO|nr:unnamed protein product [Caenorhabditis auriculariae]